MEFPAAVSLALKREDSGQNVVSRSSDGFTKSSARINHISRDSSENGSTPLQRPDHPQWRFSKFKPITNKSWYAFEDMVSASVDEIPEIRWDEG